MASSSETLSSQPPSLPQSQEASSAPNVVERNVRRKTNITWGYCKLLLNKTIVCMYCNKLFGGVRSHRVKEYLAGVSGNTKICKDVPAEVRFLVKQDYDEHNKKHSYCSRGTTPGAQPTLKSVIQSKEAVEKCDLALAKCFIDAYIPFNAANSPYYQPAVDALCCMGAGYKVSTMHVVCGNLLNNWVVDVKKRIEEYRAYWKDMGCTLMADGWTDRCRRTLINSLVYCPKGTVFVKSVNASQHCKTTYMLFKFFKVVLYVGPENVVQFVTDNASNYVAAGKLLEKEFSEVVLFSLCNALY